MNLLILTLIPVVFAAMTTFNVEVIPNCGESVKAKNITVELKDKDTLTADDSFGTAVCMINCTLKGDDDDGTLDDSQEWYLKTNVYCPNGKHDQACAELFDNKYMRKTNPVVINFTGDIYYVKDYISTSMKLGRC